MSMNIASHNLSVILKPTPRSRVAGSELTLILKPQTEAVNEIGQKIIDIKDLVRKPRRVLSVIKFHHPNTL